MSGEQGSGVKQPALPEVGSVVEVRGSTWAVTDVRAQGLSRSPADEGRSGLQHVVSLQSLEEDRMGEELSVIWELEVGQAVIPDQGLPDVINVNSFDDPNQLGAFVDAMRWGAVTSADDRRFQSPFRAGANLEPYQLEPLRRALSAPRTNLLLADDVGLGKTIEAGMVIEELLLRHRARTAIIVCPPSLCIKWQEEMLEKFGLDFTIVNSETIAECRRRKGPGANPFRMYPRVIVSMSWVPTIRAQRLLSEVYSAAGRDNSALRYAFDVLVVDEAHHVAPAAPASSGRVRGYAVDSKRTVAVRELAEHCEHRLFLSATPHNGYSESFTALLEMIDPRRFTRGAVIDEKALDEVTVRRLKTQIRELDFHERRIETIGFTPDAGEEDAYQTLDDILREAQRRNGDDSLGITSLLFKKRLLSSPWAFGRTLERYLDSRGGIPYQGEWDSYYTEVLGSGQADDEEGLDAQPENDALIGERNANPLDAAGEDQLERLEEWASQYEGRPNAKLQALMDWLDRVCRPDGEWCDERVVVFTEYRDTLTWIQAVLESHGYGNDRMAVIHGGITDDEERELIRARFNADPAQESVRVLLATDAAGEGVDLQAYCHRLVNFDVPFNPSRLEQRIGRIDRYGQSHTPEIFYFLPDENGALLNGDMAFMERLAQKVSVEKDDLGEVNPLLDMDRQVSGHFRGRHRALPATEGPRRSTEAINRALSGSMELNRQLTELGREYEDNKRRMHLSPQAELRVVDTVLDLTHQPELIAHQGKDGIEQGVYDLPKPGELNTGWRPIAEGLRSRLHPEHIRPVTFDERIARQHPDTVYMHLGSSLMDKASRTLRSTLYGRGSGLNRVTAVVMPDLEYTCAAAVSRLVLVGRGGLRVHEEVFVTGLRFGAQNLAEDKVQKLLDDALDASRHLELPDPRVLARLEEEWEANGGRLRTRLESAVSRQAQRRKQEVADRLAARREADLQRVRGIFEQFRANLDASLRELARQDEELQLALWDDEERKQRQRDIRRMRDRLDDLDAEELRELDTVRLRYEDVKAYVSIAALVFAINDRDAKQWEGQR